MRFLISMGLFLASSSGVYSQHRGGFAPVSPPAVGGGQSIGLRPPVQSWGARSQTGVGPVPTWGARPQTGVGPVSTWGVRPPTGLRPPGAWWGYGRFNHWGGGTAPYVPYLVPYPVYSNGGYYPGNFNGGYYPEIPYPYEQQYPPPMAGMPPPQPAPPVAMNQYVPESDLAPPAEHSTVQVYQAPTSPRLEPTEPQRPMVFIALKDGWVYTAWDYWVERGTLHYITTQGKHNQASLELVDRQASERLNSGKEFHLPPP
jgi:hypothetical protein